MNQPARPRVGVVVLNHDGGDLTLDCLRSLLATEWPSDSLDIVLVDNASSDGVVAKVRTELGTVRIIESAENTGFAGGCNLGIRALGAKVEHVALVNNDATVEPGWLAPLVDALAAGPTLGAACPKILFAGRFRELSISTPTQRRGRGDRRELGVWISGARVGGTDVWRRTQLVRGFWGAEPSADGSEPAGEWTQADAVVRLPVGNGAGDPRDSAQLRISAPTALTARVASGASTADLDIDETPRWVDVPFDSEPIEVINNVGTVLTSDGYGADRGYLEPDDGRFDQPEDVFAWCGGGVLLRREYLDDVGLFDERLFLYYEDLELAWRGREAGWRYGYVPQSRVHHVHAATSVDGSALKDYYNERNRLLVLARHRSHRAAAAAAMRHLAATASYARRDVVSPVLHGRAPHAEMVRRRLRAFGAFVRRAPSMRRSDTAGGPGDGSPSDASPGPV
jgi:GT2 family glycosyltransferase